VWSLVGVFVPKGFLRSACAFFPIRESGPHRVSGWERGAFAWLLYGPHLPDSGNVILSRLLATVVQDRWRREATMIRRAFFLHYRMVREAITIVVTLGTALLLSYLILWVRL
jgi:hypothetical protein